MPKANDTACSLLGFLHDRPMAGWDLSEAVQATIGYFWNVTRSQIYRELRTLEEKGLVVGGARGAREKRLYTLTDTGREAFQDWISREPSGEVARFPLLVTMWFSDHLNEEQLDWFLRYHHNEHRKRLEFYRHVYADLEDEATPAARTLRFGLFYEEAVMRWFESLSNFGGRERRSKAESAPRPKVPARPDDIAAKAGARRRKKPGAKRSR